MIFVHWDTICPTQAAGFNVFRATKIIQSQSINTSVIIDYILLIYLNLSLSRTSIILVFLPI